MFAADHVTDNTEIVFALVGLLTTMLAATVYLARGYRNTKIAARESTSASAAVNNVGPGEHRLWDKIDAIQNAVERQAAIQEAFDSHGWGNLPDDLNNAVKLTTTIRDVQRHHDETHDKLDKIMVQLAEHVEWEMQQKYQGPLG